MVLWDYNAGGFPEGLELMPQDLRSLRAKQRPVQLGRLPGAAHLRAAGQLPQRLLINHNADRDAAAAAGALQSVVPMWQGEAAHRQRYARGGEQRPIMRNRVWLADRHNIQIT